ncbi:hypothetical protein [Mycolicibacterium poriferae]|uniref:hypothetical protein n=1 Tax=Mycolicibacterium poriferae TaxID=39694 RepID=UPI0024B8F457|nr:hypothetical protein [Mycolicibacterium poriferae]
MSPAERERLTAVVRDLMSRAAAPRIVADMWSAMLTVADKADEFSANDVRRIICPDGHSYLWRQGDPGIDCDPRRAVGAVYNILASAGVIEATGQFVQNSDTAGHNGGASHQLKVWRIVARAAPEQVAELVTRPADTVETSWLFKDIQVDGPAVPSYATW